MASFQDLIDAFNARRQPANAKSKLAGSNYFMPKSSKEELAKRQATLEESGLPGVLKEAGREMYENPVVNTAIGLSPGAGDLQSAFEALKSARQGNYGEAALNLAGVAPIVPSLGFLGKTVWHGSPHVFDEFNLEKLGSGSGGAIYGPGVNLADNPEFAKRFVKEGGGLYKVDLPDESIGKLMDWDKPLMKQPKAVKEFAWKNREALEDYAKQQGLKGIFGLTGNDVYTRLLQDYEPTQISKMMQESDVPGVKYMTQKSLAKPNLEPEHNYVVFDQNLPQILERNAQPIQKLESVNPTGTVFTEYNPSQRAKMPLGENITTLDKTMEVNPGEWVTVYRGVPHGAKNIAPGDFITTNQQLAKDYAGNGKVISKRVPASHILDDVTEPLGEEYIYRP